VTVADSRRDQEALDWARRVADPGFADWEDHLLWLERDPANAEAFDRACLAMEAATEGLSAASGPAAVVPVNDNQPEPAMREQHRGWWLGAGGALAAGLAAFLLVSPLQRQVAPQIVETGPGSTRALALADGTRIILNGDSRIEIAATERNVSLSKGEAYFEVVHDASRPFAVQTGNTLIRDVGTAFDVAVGPDATRVAVSEGEVAVGRDTPTHLSAGQSARIDRKGALIRSAAPDPALAGGWRRGRLVYRDADWSDVASDLSRSLGAQVTYDPGIAKQRFTGVIVIDADHDRTIRRLAASADLVVGKDGAGWHLSPR
jgi:transmembrane sensor